MVSRASEFGSPRHFDKAWRFERGVHEGRVGSRERWHEWLIGLFVFRRDARVQVCSPSFSASSEELH